MKFFTMELLKPGTVRCDDGERFFSRSYHHPQLLVGFFVPIMACLLIILFVSQEILIRNPIELRLFKSVRDERKKNVEFYGQIVAQLQEQIDGLESVFTFQILFFKNIFDERI